MDGTASRQAERDDDGRMPRAGDVISAFYLWSQDDEESRGKKLRPCLVVKVAPDGSSIVVAPFSTKGLSSARDMLEVPQGEVAEAGLDAERRSWVKLTEVNRIDLPSAAILPRATASGKLAWRRGTVSDELLREVQKEIGYRIADKSLTGHRIRASEHLQLRLAGARKIETPSLPAADTPASLPDAQEDRETRVARKAAELAQRRAQMVPPVKAPVAALAAGHAR